MLCTAVLKPHNFIVSGPPTVSMATGNYFGEEERVDENDSVPHLTDKRAILVPFCCTCTNRHTHTHTHARADY